MVLTGLSRVDSQGCDRDVSVRDAGEAADRIGLRIGQPARDIPRLVSLYQEGRLKLRELVSRTYALDKVNDALAALAASDGARGVIKW